MRLKDLFLNGFLLLLLVSGCRPMPTQRVVVYCALDREFAAPVLAEFEGSHDIVPLAKYDIESTKSVGLTRALMAERRRTRCDVFWNNEILNTLRLERAGLLQRLPPAWWTRFPPSFRSAEGHWCGFAARARVLLVNSELVSEHAEPDSIEDLVDPAWRHRVGVARPLFGTMATHAAVWYAEWGPAKTHAFFRALRENVRVLSGNRQVAAAVSQGELAWGLTDTDDAWGAIRNGFPVRMVYPDQGPRQPGTLFIPNTVAILDGAPHQAAAQSLTQFLLSAQVEQRLADGPSGQFPLRDLAASESREIQGIRLMEVDFYRAADGADEIWRWLREERW